MKYINIILLFSTLFIVPLKATNTELPKASITFEQSEYTLIKGKKEDIEPILEHAKSCIWSIPPQDTAYVKLYPFGKDLVLIPLKIANRSIRLKCTTSQVEEGYQSETKYITLNLKNQYYFIVSYLLYSPKETALIFGEKWIFNKIRKRDRQKIRYIEFYIDPKYVNSVYDSYTKTIKFTVYIPEVGKGHNKVKCPIDTANQRCIYLRLDGIGNKVIHTEYDHFPRLSHIYYGYPRHSNIKYRCYNPEFGRWFSDLSHFYFISCPTRKPKVHVYDSNQKEITNEYGKSWILYKYDTHERSINGPDNAWEKVDFPNDTLKLGQGYLLGFLDGLPTPVSMIFHSYIDTKNLIELSDFNMDIPDYSQEAKSPLDANWQFIGATSYQEEYTQKSLCTQHYRNGIYQIDYTNNTMYENEGVFIQTPSGQTSLPFSHNRRSVVLEKNQYSNKLTLTLKNEQHEYFCILALNDEATTHYDIGYDIMSLNKIDTLNHNGIYFLNHQKALVQCYAPFSQNEIPILVCSNKQQNYSLHWKGEDPNIQRCILTDSLLMKQTDLCQQDYSFKCDSGHFFHRFSIAINGSIKDGINSIETCPFYWKTTPHYLHLYNIPTNSILTIYTTTGQCILNKEIKGSNQDIYRAQSGIYICQIHTAQKSYPFVWID